jgi:hypothetical protein
MTEIHGFRRDCARGRAIGENAPAFGLQRGDSWVDQPSRGAWSPSVDTQASGLSTI